jgi:hypothetical protein
MKARAAVAFAAGLAMSACTLAGSGFRPDYVGPQPVMQRLATAARQCGFTDIHTGPPLVRSSPDETGLRIGDLRGGRQFDCLLQWSRVNGIDLRDHMIIHDRAPE